VCYARHAGGRLGEAWIRNADRSGMTLRRHDTVLALPQHQRAARLAVGQSALDAEPNQFFRIPDIDTFLKIGPHDAILDPCLQALPGSMGDQEMRASAIGHAFDQIEAKLHPHRLALAYQNFLRGRDPRWVADLGGQILSALRTVPGHFRVQLKRPPGHARFVLRTLRQGEFEAPLAEETPGTHRVGVDIDSHLRSHQRHCTRPLIGFVANEYHPRMTRLDWLA